VLKLLEDLAGLAPIDPAERIEASRRALLRRMRRLRVSASIAGIFRRALQCALPLAVALALAVVAVLAWSTGERRSGQRELDRALRELRSDPRWKDVGAIAVSPGKDLALALRMIEGDLPAFAALDSRTDPDSRFWARCVAGAGILGWIAPEEAPVLGRSGIRRAVEEAIAADLEATVGGWVDEAREAVPSARVEADRGFPALLTRLEVAGKVMAGMAGSDDPAQASLAPVRERAAGLAAAARELEALVDSAARLPAELGKMDRREVEKAEGAFWARYSAAREAAPAEGWRRLLDGAAAAALVRGLRAWWADPRDRNGPSGPAALATLRLVARIRELGGCPALVDGWSEAGDPLYPVLWPLVR
jgi:hypothetical protein